MAIVMKSTAFSLLRWSYLRCDRWAELTVPPPWVETACEPVSNSGCAGFCPSAVSVNEVGGERLCSLAGATSSPVRPAGLGDLAAHMASTTEATRMIDDRMANLVSTLLPNWPAANLVGRGQHGFEIVE
jgi:hypothetical protein